MIIIVDIGLGNPGSVYNILKKIGVDSLISSEPKHIAEAEKLIVPGVGSFDAGMRSLKEHNLAEMLTEMVLVKKVPVLGICLGMQMFTGSSEEGREKGLGWVAARTVRFNPGAAVGLRIPHMGWNQVVPRKASSLFVPIENEIRYYFVHSYHVVCDNSDDILATAHHGYEFVAAFQCRNIIGVQFHPEKSHRYGMEFMKAFALGGGNV